MQNQNQFLAFTVEIFNRIATKKPKLFVYLQYIVLALGAVTGLPAFLTQLGVTLTPSLTIFENKFVAAAASGFWLASQLVTKPAVVGVTKDGAVITQTDPVRLPFSSEVEVKKAQVDQIPNSNITLSEIKTVSKINS